MSCYGANGRLPISDSSGSGGADQSDYAPVSERHDEALEDAVYAEMREKADEFSRRHGSG